MSTAYIHLIQHQLTRKSLMISVGTATETVLVKKKGKVLSSLYRISLKMEYLAQYKWQLHMQCWNKSLTDISNIVTKSQSVTLNIHFASSHIFFATIPTPVTYMYT